MTTPEPAKSQDAAEEAGTPALEEIGHLRRQEMRYWYLLAGICIVVTAGLAFAISPLLTERLAELWPWANTSIVLLSGLLLTMWLMVTYLTIQKRKTRQIRQKLQEMALDAAKRERQNTARLRALLNVSRMMGSVTNLENVFESITDTCIEVFDCERASLMLVNEATRELETRAVTGHENKEEVLQSTLKIGEGVAGWVAEQQKPLVLNADADVSQYQGLELRDPSISAAMVVPILLRDELVGVLNISSRIGDAKYSEEDLQALQVFAENAGTCIRHTEHVEWMRKTIRDTMGAVKRPDKKSEALTQE